MLTNTSKNIEKYERYKELCENLKKALNNGFYYEAIFIEYAIFEDRLSSLIKYAGLSLISENKTISITKKINTIIKNKIFNDDYIRDRLTVEILNSILVWKDKRNSLIHELANKAYGEDNSKEIAIEGNELLIIFKNKSKSVINYLKKDSNV